MKRLIYFFLLLTVISVLSTSCSSTRNTNSKGGGWYHNRNVNLIDVKEESVVYQTEEENCADFQTNLK